MNIRFLLFIILISILVTGCTITGDVVHENYLNSDSKIEDFAGNPSIILFGATYCSHCQNAIPIFKEKIYDIYSSKVNIWINVIDDEEFDILEIPQGLNSNLDFTKITGQECNYVPSWIILDKKTNVVLTSCGGEKDLDEMIKEIHNLVEEK